MAVQKQDGLHTDVAKGAVDLTGKEDLFCARDAAGLLVITGNGARIDGVISQGRDADHHTSYNTLGNPILRVQAGAAIAQNASVQSNGTGQAITGTDNPAGYARSAVGGSGEIVEVVTEPSRT